MRFRAAVAALLSFALVTETTFVARAGETDDVPTSEAPEATSAPEATLARLTPFWAVAPPSEIDVGARLAFAGPMADGVTPFHGTRTKAIMSSNAKTVLIVAIIAGAVLLVVGVIVIGKPFGKKP